LPIAARVTAKALKTRFAVQGGNSYLHQLFPGGPVTQGSRFANVRTPAYATDPSFGTSY
jgi:tRNA 2-thiouridine synthesizing protein E